MSLNLDAYRYEYDIEPKKFQCPSKKIIRCHRILGAKLLTMIVELMKDEKEDLKFSKIHGYTWTGALPSSPGRLLTASDIHSLPFFYFIFGEPLFVIFSLNHNCNFSNLV